MSIQPLNSWVDDIGAWHREAFPWAKLPHVMEKLREERKEATMAWARADDDAIKDELADCLICVLAAMAREGIDAEQALASKFELVRKKYDKPQPSPEVAGQMTMAL